MQILSKEIQDFIEQIKELNTVGCLTIPQSQREILLDLLAKADVIVGTAPSPGRITYQFVYQGQELGRVKAPFIFVVTEEDYSADPEWATALREQVAYFLNVK